MPSFIVTQIKTGWNIGDMRCFDNEVDAWKYADTITPEFWIHENIADTFIRVYSVSPNEKPKRIYRGGVKRTSKMHPHQVYKKIPVLIPDGYKISHDGFVPPRENELHLGVTMGGENVVSVAGYDFGPTSPRFILEKK